MENRVLVIGLGLIGGSLALSIKERHPSTIIIGFDVDSYQSRLAKMLKVVDECVESIPTGAKDADVIIIATPVSDALEIITELTHCPLKKNVIITDAGSTKKSIMKKAASLNEKGIHFIGGHPMAGSHKSGVTAAKKILFENAYYLLTPPKGMKREPIERLKNILSGTKARFLELTASEHDYLTGVISHLPHIVAASLVHQAVDAENQNPHIPSLAAGGFRDITRIASSNPKMWRDILFQNKDQILQLLDRWQIEMNRISFLLGSNDEDGVLEYFSEAKHFRDGLSVNEKGAIPSFYDLYVDVPDYPGVISEITGYLAKEKISITNIRILETREEIFGVLVISFQNEKDRQKAKNCLEKNTQYQTALES